MTPPSAGGVAGVLAFFDAVDLIVRDSLLGSQSSKIEPDAQRALRRIADMLEAAPQARAAVEAMAGALQNLRDAHIAHRGNYPLPQSADYSAMQSADAALAAFESAAPAGGGGEELVAKLQRSLHDLGEHRQTHVVWRDWLLKDPANEQVNPHAGSAKFHDDTIKDYDRHLANIEEAIRRLASTGSAPAPSAWRPDYHTLRCWLFGIGVVGQIDGHEVIRRDSVVSLLERWLAAPTQENQE